MKISHAWLSDFIDWKEHDTDMIADMLTKCTGEVDDIVKQGMYLHGCVVGKIEKVWKHPNADSLSVASVQTDKGTIQVVCGGTNLREGMLVPFVHVGGTVRGDGNDVITLKSVKIRGEQSNGMIAAAEEIGLSSMFPPKASDGARPIIDLTVLNLNVGMQLAKALQLDDVTFHIDNHAITHRADLFSHRGIARECVALNLATWKKTKTKKRPVFPRKPLPFTMAKVRREAVRGRDNGSTALAAGGIPSPVLQNDKRSHGHTASSSRRKHR
jgi:phenylalanyl-tRNA synthetase beta chain